MQDDPGHLQEAPTPPTPSRASFRKGRYMPCAIAGQMPCMQTDPEPEPKPGPRHCNPEPKPGGEATQPRPGPRPCNRSLTNAERDHLVNLGMIAGSVMVMDDAMRSGDVFDPAHMERARAIGAELERRVQRERGQARPRSTCD